ncbi:hypothetical protein COD79_30190 [Bacillus cereus]|uniref:alginate lyase family protein n=1 Tax=Bacillus cereus TaxID=1396 RepID=UPI000BFB6A43|nr:alginate lyase family protein [Bacillus cereus]PGV20703.1 hypothetical protein COD79_30190 [Bacillus cereus]
MNRYDKPYIHIPFDCNEYKNVGWDTDCLPEVGYLYSEKYKVLGATQRSRLLLAMYRLKNNYIMNNNVGRNIALRDGKSRAKWILPWDGNCFLTDKAWNSICADIKKSRQAKYFAVPMVRVTENKQLLSKEFSRVAREEPQLIFRKDSKEGFNEEFCYGRRPKVELLWRLGIPGMWDNIKEDPWDQIRRPLSDEAGQFAWAGWVARLSSGMDKLEKDIIQRGITRSQAILNTIRHTDHVAAGTTANSKELSFYRMEVLKKERNSYITGKHYSPINQLIVEAEEALTRGPYSVTDKTSLPPSSNLNDYWHPAPYWWPNPYTSDGLPYIRKDGERVPGTRMYEPQSEKYDRTRLQRVFDDSITLALAWYFTGKNKYAEHGIHILEQFFINPVTRMNPHLLYAQVIMGRNNNKGSGRGIIEMKDIYFYLDAIRLLELSGALREATLSKFNEWLATYLDWLIYSDFGKKECGSLNNHGTYYDLQVAAIADFLGDKSLLVETFIRSQSRISHQFAPNGLQTHEIARKDSMHYCIFNFQGWINIAEIASRWGTNLWSYKATDGTSLKKGVECLFSHINSGWPYSKLNPFDTERYFPILFGIPKDYMKDLVSSNQKISKYSIKSRFFPHDGIRPFWNLGLI